MSSDKKPPKPKRKPKRKPKNGPTIKGQGKKFLVSKSRKRARG